MSQPPWDNRYKNISDVRQQTLLQHIRESTNYACRNGPRGTMETDDHSAFQRLIGWYKHHQFQGLFQLYLDSLLYICDLEASVKLGLCCSLCRQPFRRPSISHVSFEVTPTPVAAQSENEHEPNHDPASPARDKPSNEVTFIVRCKNCRFHQFHYACLEKNYRRYIFSETAEFLPCPLADARGRQNDDISERCEGILAPVNFRTFCTQADEHIERLMTTDPHRILQPQLSHDR